MDELYYHAIDLAIILEKLNLSVKEEMKVLDDIWQKERAFLTEKHRLDKKQYVLDVMFWKNQLHDSEVFERELPEIFNTMNEIGIGESFYETLMQNQGVELFFKNTRITLSCLNRPYVSCKLRTLLSQYGYKRRSKQFIEYIVLCLYFYHIKIYAKGNKRCFIDQISLDDRIMFRL